MEPCRCPLREAARRSGIPEERLRRRILEGDLVATPVDDDRQYLVRLADLLPPTTAAGPALPRRAFSWRVTIFLIVAFLLLLFASCGTFTMHFYCANCGLDQKRIETGLGHPSISIFSKTEWTDLSEAIARSYPGPCRHEWIFTNGSGQGIT